MKNSYLKILQVIKGLSSIFYMNAKSLVIRIVRIASILVVFLLTRNKKNYTAIASLILVFVSFYFLAKLHGYNREYYYVPSFNTIYAHLVINQAQKHPDTLINTRGLDDTERARKLLKDVLNSEEDRDKKDLIYKKYYKNLGQKTNIEFEEGLKEEIEIGVFSNYFIDGENLFYSVSFDDFDIDEKTKSSFKRDAILYLNFSDILDAEAFIMVEDTLPPYEEKIIKTFDFIDRKGGNKYDFRELKMGRLLNDSFKILKIEVDTLPYRFEVKIGRILHSNYDISELDLYSGITSTSGYFELGTNIGYNPDIEILNAAPQDNLIELNSLDAGIYLKNLIEEKSFDYIGEKDRLERRISLTNIPEEERLSEERYLYYRSTAQRNLESHITVKYRNHMLTKKKELFSIILSLLIGTGISGLFNVFLNR